MSSSENDGASRRISVDLPNQDIERLDHLKREWGLRGRGDVLKRLLEEIFPNNVNQEAASLNLDSSVDNNNSIPLNNKSSIYNEDKALVLITKADLRKSENIQSTEDTNQLIDNNINTNNSSYSKGIDLPGFVRNKTSNLRSSLEKQGQNENREESVINTITNEEVNSSLVAAINHWNTLYGSKPNDSVVEAAMFWLARDIWPNLENTEGLTFTWSGANTILKDYCSSWQDKPPTFQRIIVLAGLLEDPFSSGSLTTRVPTLIRRFVNKFKRNRNVTSFQTLESTMTVHGALKLLDLPTRAGASLTLSRIRDAYKSKAMEEHPDSGGSTDSMRRVNEAYLLLKDLYRKTE